MSGITERRRVPVEWRQRAAEPAKLAVTQAWRLVQKIPP